MSQFEQTERTRLRLYHELGTFDRDEILAIIDEIPILANPYQRSSCQNSCQAVQRKIQQMPIINRGRGYCRTRWLQKNL